RLPHPAALPPLAGSAPVGVFAVVVRRPPSIPTRAEVAPLAPVIAPLVAVLVMPVLVMPRVGAPAFVVLGLPPIAHAPARLVALLLASAAPPCALAPSAAASLLAPLILVVVAPISSVALHHPLQLGVGSPELVPAVRDP